MVTVSINVNSNPSHVDENHFSLNEKGIHSLCQNEMKLDDTLSDNHFKFESYNLQRLGNFSIVEGLHFSLQILFTMENLD